MYVCLSVCCFTVFWNMMWAKCYYLPCPGAVKELLRERSGQLGVKQPASNSSQLEGAMQLQLQAMANSEAPTQPAPTPILRETVGALALAKRQCVDLALNNHDKKIDDKEQAEFALAKQSPKT